MIDSMQRPTGPKIVSTTTGPQRIPGGGMTLDALMARQKALASQQVPMTDMQSPMQGVAYAANRLLQGFQQGRAERDLSQGRDALAKAMATFNPDTGEFAPEALQTLAALEPDKAFQYLHDMAESRRQAAQRQESHQWDLQSQQAGFTHSDQQAALQHEQQELDNRIKRGEQLSDAERVRKQQIDDHLRDVGEKQAETAETRTYEAGQKKVTQLTAEEVAAKRYRPGTVVERDINGNETVVQAPEAAKAQYGPVITGDAAKAEGLDPTKSYQRNQQTQQWDQVGGSGTTINTGDKVPDWVSTDAGFYQRAKLAALDLNDVDDKLATAEAAGQGIAGSIPYIDRVAPYFQSDDYKTAMIAGDAWIRAVLRKESGATIPDAEMAGYRKTFLPQPGDGPQQVQQKRLLREQTADSLGIGVKSQAPALFQSLTDSITAAQKARQAARGGGSPDTAPSAPSASASPAAPATDAAAPPATGGGPDEKTTLQDARDAIAAGADPAAVKARLRKMGIDPGKL
jgi:hypothetical protein